jgi:hypothetical protein
MLPNLYVKYFLKHLELAMPQLIILSNIQTLCRVDIVGAFIAVQLSSGPSIFISITDFIVTLSVVSYVPLSNICTSLHLLLPHVYIDSHMKYLYLCSALSPCFLP